MKFRKRPVEVEAVRFLACEAGLQELKAFCGDALGRVVRSPGMPAEAEICTLEDANRMVVKHVAIEGDWVIRGIMGEIYPCKDDIFKRAYEEIQ